jgi:membrane protease YdiL (CAAX protease family)
MEPAPNPSDGFRMAVLVEGGLVLVSLVLASLFGIRLVEQLPTDWQSFSIAFARGVAVAAVMLVVFFVVYRLPFAEFRRLREQVEWLVLQLFPRGNLAQFALVALLAGIGEELLFRGVIQTLLIRWTSPMTGLIIGSLLFGLAHSLSRLYFVLAFIIGLLMGWLTLHYTDLTAPIVAHAVYDFVALAYLAKQAQRDIIV